VRLAASGTWSRLERAPLRPWRRELEVHETLDQPSPLAQQELLEGLGDRRQPLTAVVDQVPVEHGGKPLHIQQLEAYNRAFSALELPWRWDLDMFQQLLSAAGEGDCVGAYVERNQPHLLRVYEKAFLRDLVHDARERCRQEMA
jgi:hypothetical protein